MYTAVIESLAVEDKWVSGNPVWNQVSKQPHWSGVGGLAMQQLFCAWANPVPSKLQHFSCIGSSCPGTKQGAGSIPGPGCSRRLQVGMGLGEGGQSCLCPRRWRTQLWRGLHLCFCLPSGKRQVEVYQGGSSHLPSVSHIWPSRRGQTNASSSASESWLCCWEPGWP